MSRKRKRSHVSADPSDRVAKRSRLGPPPCPASTPTHPHPIDRSPLPLYYPQVSSLRAYLLAQLPQSSRSRRRRIEDCGARSRDPAWRASAPLAPAPESKPKLAETSPRQDRLATLLDSIIVGSWAGAEVGERDGDLALDLERFSQKLRSTGRTSTSSIGDPLITQSDVSFFDVHRHGFTQFFILKVFGVLCEALL